MLSPDSIRPNIFDTPPPEVVSIFILSLIQLIDPPSLIIVSPVLSSQITTGNGVPSIEYFI
jgi:hypothetical protein